RKAMQSQIKTSEFQQAIEAVENLSLDDQEVLLSILQKRLNDQRRIQIAQEVTEAKAEYTAGNFTVGTVDQFLSVLEES
ncbi:MAG: hypothetical protein ACO3LN_17825, partial [bacterium]